jgi:hypothetical protein
MNEVMMKKLLLPVALMLMSSAYAQTCLESICSGDVVIDSSDYVGSVVGIVDNKLIYRVGSSEYRSIPSSLSKEVSDENFTKGKTVLTSSDSIGTVLYVFANGKIQYNVSGYKYVSRDLAYEVPSYADLLPSTEVMNNNESIGNVVKLFSNGRVQYSISNYKYFSPASDLYKKIETIDGLKEGSSVINTNESIGVVKKIFKNGKVQYSISNYNYVTPSKNLSLEVKEIGELSANTNVINSNDSIGVVKRLFANGKVQYSISNYNYITPATNLSIEVSSLGNLSAGKTVINTNDSIGEVNRLFKNGKVQYSISNYKYITNEKNLFLENTGLGSVKTGSIVLTSNDSVATVLKTFDNDKVQASISNYKYIFNLSSLSPEVSEHPLYNKQDTYALNRTIGKVAHFFENEKVALRSENGNLIVGKTLAAEVPSLGRVSEGNTIVTSSGADVKVVKLFENNTVQIEETSVVNGKEVKAKKGITLILNASEMTSDVVVDYAYDVYRNVDGEKVFYYGSLLEEVAPIKKKLVESIKEIKSRFYTDKRTYKKFLAEIGATDDSVDDDDNNGPISDETLLVRINNSDLKEIIAKELQKKKINYAITDKLDGAKILDITIERTRKVPFTKCSIKMEYTQKSENSVMRYSSSKKKSVLGWGKKSCKSVVKKVLKEFI